MKVRILDAFSVQYYQPKSAKPILIRILEPYYLDYGIPYTLLYEKDYQAILELYFDDVGLEVLDYPDQTTFQPFTLQMAKEVLSFVTEHRPTELIIHCQKGQSRSPGVLLGLAKSLGMTDLVQAVSQDTRYLPNSLVLKVFQELIQQTKIVSD